MIATPSLIRELFLHARATYTSAEAADAIGMSVDEIEGWMEVGELEGIDVTGDVVLDAVLPLELRDLVSAQSDWLSSVIPGFAAALRGPIENVST